MLAEEVKKEEHLLYDLALAQIPGIGPVLTRALLARLGSSEAVLKERKHALMKVEGIGERLASVITTTPRGLLLERASREMAFMAEQHIAALHYRDERYPRRLRHCEDAPQLLFLKGPVNLNESRVLGIVGTRSNTPYGRQVCEDIVVGLASHQVSIMSGLAYGIDIIAHQAALECGLPTVGVLAHGLHMIYPAVHRRVARSMTEQGGLLSEYMSGTQADKENFPRRNRIVAGLCDAILVVETGLRGGSMITAMMANAYHRDVFAIPGRAGQACSAGCNLLIKENRAALVENAADIARMMGWDESTNNQSATPLLFPEVSPDEQLLLHLLEREGKCAIDVLCRLSRFPVSRTSTLLLNLEFGGFVRTLPGKVYELA